jgi:50S ribosomal subunit-associated GTPase HflX
VFNKMDLIAEPDAFGARVSASFENAVFVSAEKGEVEELVRKLGEGGRETGKGEAGRRKGGARAQ